MGYPEMTDDQRAMAVEMLANALRKDAHLRERAHRLREDSAPLAAATRGRADSSQRYIDGMQDLLRVLFADGHAEAEACLEAAYALALGVGSPLPRSGNGSKDH
jgi:hypothetical protein